MSDTQFVIWSHEHRQWWGPDHAGYTSDLAQAGRYSFQEAAYITVCHVPPGEEVAVSEIEATHYGATLVWGAHLDDAESV